MGHHEYRPLADMLVEMAERYRKPIFLSETGAEGIGKPSWLHYVCNEVRDAMSRGADIRGHLLVPDHRLSGLGQFAPRGNRAVVDGASRTAAGTSTSGCSRSSRSSGRCSRDWRTKSVSSRPRAASRVTGAACGLVRRRADVRPAVPPFDAVDQQDPAAVDLVFLALPRPVHVDCVIDDPHLPRLVDDDANCGPGRASVRF